MTLGADQTLMFRTLEESLWREDPTEREGILAEEFTEFCRFGNIYDRDHLLQPSSNPATVEFPFDNFQAEQLTEDVVLVTYENRVTNEGETQRARRSSVWVRRGSDWKLRFMQATTLED